MTGMKVPSYFLLPERMTSNDMPKSELQIKYPNELQRILVTKDAFKIM